MNSRDNASALVRKTRGGIATVYSCPFCRYAEVMPRGIRGAGRGYGLRMGGGLSAKVAAHIRKEHGDKVTQA